MNASVVKSMFNHLVQSYSDEEAREILIGKYPDQEGEIILLARERSGVDGDEDDMREVNELVEAVRRKQAAKPKVAKSPKAAKAPKPAKVAKTPRGESKMSRARELFAKQKDQSRKAVIAVFVEKLGLSPVAASTYFYACKK